MNGCSVICPKFCLQTITEIESLQCFDYKKIRYLTYVRSNSDTGPFQTPFHSCAEPNSIRFDFGATADSDGVLASDVFREGQDIQFSMGIYAF